MFEERRTAHMKHHSKTQGSTYTHLSNKLEALRERRPPWPRQIITPILPTVKMLSLGGERLRPPLPPPQKKGSLPAPRSGYATTIIVCFFAHLLILE